jgi:hypothetical protein
MTYQEKVESCRKWIKEYERQRRTFLKLADAEVYTTARDHFRAEARDAYARAQELHRKLAKLERLAA